MQDGYTHTIDGQGQTSDRFFEVINPATGEPFARCPDASQAQLNQAVTAARQAFAHWRHTTVDERRTRLRSFAAALKARQQESR